MILLAPHEGFKITSFLSSSNSELLESTEDILENLINTEFEDGSYDTYLKNMLKVKQDKLKKLDTFLQNDPNFRVAKNHTLRAKYLNELQTNSPDIYNLFKYTPYSNNPLNYLDSVYQIFK